MSKRERSGSVVECLTRDRRAAGLSLTAVTALWSLSKTHLSYYPSLVLVQPRKTCSYITERLLMGRKESNQTNKHMSKCLVQPRKTRPYITERLLMGRKETNQTNTCQNLRSQLLFICAYEHYL